jgi:t-SNARE complex subunit (syntaxin)
MLLQAQQIEMLYKQALEATFHLERGNKELHKTVEYNRGGRKYFLYLILMATLLLLFLDYITK